MSGSSAFIRSFECFQYSATSPQHPRGAPLAQGTHVTPSSLETKSVFFLRIGKIGKKKLNFAAPKIGKK